MADSRIKDLTTTEPNLTYDYYLAIDKTGITDAKKMTLLTLLRSGNVDTVDESGNSTATADFSSYNVIDLTIDQDCAVSFTGLQNNETLYLNVTKGSTDIISFPSATGTIDSKQQGQTSLIFRIITNSPSILVEQVNNQFSYNLDSADITSSDGTITSFNYFTAQINNNICNFEASFTIQIISTKSDLTFDIANFDVIKVNSNKTSCNSFVTDDGGFKNTNAHINATELIIDTEGDFGGITTSNIVIEINGSFQIK